VRYRERRAELERLAAETTLARLDAELVKLRREQLQGILFDDEGRLPRLERSIEEKEAELRRRRDQHEEITQQLAAERGRVLEQILPRRYRLAGRVQVFPVGLEVRLPGNARRATVCPAGTGSGTEGCCSTPRAWQSWRSSFPRR
jgi:hypothetical protein